MTLTMAFVKCLKFTANIYDKNRCKNCYKPKELHSEAALESSKVSRKISKCGYMFVAPETFDFSNPLDKTRRWQRRFLVLYDDGELTYSVDENINTVPQGVIDMNKCVDVYDAENVTSHASSIAVATADNATYIKGAVKEETNRWHDVLVMYPRSTKTKHKRYPTFPQTKSASLNQSLPPSITTPTHSSPVDNTQLSTSFSEDSYVDRRQRTLSSPGSTLGDVTMNGSGLREGGSSREPRLGTTGRSKSLGGTSSPARGSLGNGDALPASSVASSATKVNAEQHHPLTYRGVRSLKHRHDKSYNDGLRKSNSMHDLSSSPSSPNGDGFSESFGESRFQSHSRESLSGLSVSDSFSELRSRSKSTGDVNDVCDGSSDERPKTFFEFLVTEGSKPQPKSSKYKRLAGIPQTKPIEDFTPWQDPRVRRKSVPTTDIERMAARNVVGTAAKFWEAKSSEAKMDKAKSPSNIGKVGTDKTELKAKSVPAKTKSTPSLQSDGTASPKLSANQSRSTSNLAKTPNNKSPAYAKVAPNVASVSPARNLIKKRQPIHSPKSSAPSAITTLRSATKTGTKPSLNSNTATKISPNVFKTSLRSSPATSSPAHPAANHPSRVPPQKNRFYSPYHHHLKPPSHVSQDKDSSRQEPPTSTPAHPLPPWASPHSQAKTEVDGGAMFQSRSPTTSLLLNGHNKNETDERKMAQSELGNSLISDDGQHMDSSRVTVTTGDDSRVLNRSQQVLDYVKKGWLVKQGGTERDWKKFWFVLSGSTLKYFEDMEAERIGTADGAINLSQCYDMSEVSVSRKYGFRLKTRHGDHTLSALTLGIRNSWMQAIGQCIQANGGSLRSESMSPRDVSPQNPRRTSERYHTHSGAFSSPTRDSVDSSQNASPQLQSGVSATNASKLSNGSQYAQNKSRPELKTSEPPRFIVRRSGSEDVSISLPGGSTDGGRTRSRRRTTDNVTKLTESTVMLSPTKPAPRHSCTWPFVSPDPVVQSPRSSNSSRSHSPRSTHSAQEQSVQRDLSQYLDEKEEHRTLTPQEQEELDNVERNIRNIHRKSLTDINHTSKPKHFDKFETGSAFSGSSDRHNSIERLTSSRESSPSPARLSSRDSSLHSSPSRSRVPSFDRTLNDSSPLLSPSAKIKEKTKAKLSRAKSPPPEKLDTDDDYLDTFVRVNLEQGQSDSLKTPTSPAIDARWREVEKSSERRLGHAGSDNALVALLETEVESLKTQLEQTKVENINLQNLNSEMKMELHMKRRHNSEYMHDVELDQSRFMSQLEDYQLEMQQANELVQNKFVETQLTEKQVEDLQVQLRDSNTKIQIQEDELKSLQAKLSVSMTELSNLEQCLTESAQDLREEQEASQRIIEDLERKLQEMEKILEERDSRILNQDQEIDLHLEKIHLLEVDLQEKRCKLESTGQEIRNVDALKQDLIEKGNLATAMTQEADLLRKQLREQDEILQKTQRNNMDKVKSMESEFYREKERLQRRVDQLQQHIEQISKQTSIADSLNTNMADILKEKDETIAQLEEKLIENEMKLEEMTEEMNLEVDDNNKLQKNVRDMNDENEQLHKQVIDLQAEVNDLEQAYNGAIQEVRDMGRKLGEKDTEKELLRMDLERVERKYKELELEGGLLKNTFSKSQGELDKHASSLSTFKAQLADKDLALEQLGEDYRSVCDELERARDDISHLTEENQRQTGDIESMEKLNNTSLAELDEVRCLYKDVLHNLGESENRIADLELAHKSDDGQITKTRKDLEEALSQISTYKSQVERQSQEIKQILLGKNQSTQQLHAASEQHQLELESKCKELSDCQKLVDELKEKLFDSPRSNEMEISQVVVSPLKASIFDRNDSARSSLCSTASSQSDTPQTLDELQQAYKKLKSEHRTLKKDHQEVTIKKDEQESINLSLKQEQKNIHEGYQSQVDSQGAKIQELHIEIANMEKRNRKLERRSKTREIRNPVHTETQTDHFPESDSPSNADELSMTVQELQNELDQSDSKVNQLMKRLLQQRSFEVELNLLHQQLETMDAENKAIRESLSKEGANDEKNKDHDSVGQLRELQVKIQQTIGLLEDCLGKLSDTIIDMDDSVMHGTLASSNPPSSTKHSLQSVLVTLKDAKALLPHPVDGNQVSDISSDVKLRLFAERLAMEAVVLGEMSYLVRSGRSVEDNELTDLFTAKAKVEEISQFMLEHYCKEGTQSSSPSEEESMTTYAALLSDKMRLQSQLLVAMDDIRSLADGNVDVFVTDNKSMQDVAQTSLAKASLSSKLPLLPSPVDALHSSACHSLARTDLECVLTKLRAAESGRCALPTPSNQSQEAMRLSQQMSADSSSLAQKLMPVIEQKCKDIAGVLIRCDKCGSDAAQGSSYLQVFSKELHHITHRYLSIRGTSIGAVDSDSHTDFLYSQHFSEHLCSVAEREISKVLQDIEFSCEHFSGQISVLNQEEAERCESERTSLILELGFIVAQKSLVQSLSGYLSSNQSFDANTTSISTGAKLKGFHSSASTTSLPELFSSSSEQQEFIATMLARGAASRNSLASFFLNNTARSDRHVADAESWQDQLTSLATQLVSTDLKISKHNHTAPDYESLVTQEAISQAQLSYLHYCLKVKHTDALEQLHIKLESSKIQCQAEQEQEVGDMNDELEHLEEQLDEAQKQLEAAEQSAQAEISDLHSELERKENGFRQEVQALKDGYEIRIRSLQSDLDVAKRDLDKVQQEREHEGHQFEESMLMSVQDYESKIEKICSEKEQEHMDSHRRIVELNEEIQQLKVHHRKAVEELNQSKMNASLVNGAEADPENAELIREKTEQVQVLRVQMEDGRKRHVEELERLREAMDGDDNAAAHALLTSKIQQLEEQISNMQHDYEQELSIQKTAHRREMARSVDDMMQLMASADIKNIHIDEDAIRKRYVKELDKIKSMYDRSFGAMEKSHQKVLMQMRKAHKRELDGLRAEKDQVLNEETKATQAALDAMRKAHESELQRERNKFLDAIAKTFSQRDVESLQQQHEADLDLIQGELKQLSEQYSMRCLEKAALEERLEAQAKSLHQSRKRIQDLMASRDELNTRIKHEIEKLKRQVFSGSTAGTAGDGRDAQLQLKVKEAEINQLTDELNILKDQLTSTAEELGESMNKYEDLHALHSVAEQRHRRDLEELRRQTADQSSLEVGEEESVGHASSGRSTPDLQEGLGHSSNWMVINSDIMTSTPFRDADAFSSKKHREIASRETSLSKVQGATLAEPSPGRRLPNITPERRTAKKALWRQRQPERARSNPGMTGSVTLTLQKQLSCSMAPAPVTFDPRQRPPRIMKSSLSVDLSRGCSDEKV